LEPGTDVGRLDAADKVDTVVDPLASVDGAATAPPAAFGWSFEAPSESHPMRAKPTHPTTRSDDLITGSTPATAA